MPLRLLIVFVMVPFLTGYFCPEFKKAVFEYMALGRRLVFDFWWFYIIWLGGMVISLLIPSRFEDKLFERIADRLIDWYRNLKKSDHTK